MKKSKKYYITTAIDYVNARPHIGHAFEKVIADSIARWQRLNGKQVFFLTGTDENAQKNAQAAKEAGIPTKQFVDKNVKAFIELCKKLNLSNDDFIRTTEQRHIKVAQEIFEKVYKKGDIYKGTYEGLYCYGCEAYKTEKDLVNGKCPQHPNREIVTLKEEAYFFRLSNYKARVEKFVKNYVVPEKRRNEILSRLKEEELRDLCVSRQGLDWGIDVPFDKKHKIYVWFDALINYISGSQGNWPADLHIIGKDINWFHSVIWPAMLISAGYELPKKLLVHGFLNLSGRKISKSIGNVVDPLILIDKYGTDVVRYSLLRCSIFEDSDYGEDILIERNNKELADKLGNLVSRVSALAEQHGLEKCENKLLKKLKLKEIKKCFENFEVDKALALILEFVDECNLYVQENELWKTHDRKKLYELCDSIKAIAILLWPFMPETSEKIAKVFGFKIENLKQIEKPIEIKKIKKSEILFKKIELKEESKLKEKEVEKEKMEIVPFKEWQKIDLRVGKILAVKPHPNADKLVLLDIDLGELGKRTLVAGIKQYYNEKELKGKQVVVFTNLEPKEVRGIKSEGMILAAVNKDKSKVILIAPEKEIEPGSKVE
ncbi:MAG: methionine--tRNA ligase [Candidatus Pacearchaeota archaeon]